MHNYLIQLKIYECKKLEIFVSITRIAFILPEQSIRNIELNKYMEQSFAVVVSTFVKVIIYVYTRTNELVYFVFILISYRHF